MVLLTKWRLRAIQDHSQSWLQDALNFPSESTDGRSGAHTRPVIPRVTTASASASNFGTPAEESVIGATLKGRGRFSPEMYINRFLQIFLFVISYTFSRSVVEFNAWTRHFEFTLLLAAGFVILYLLLLYLLPSYVPVFLQLMALPPFLDDDNLKVFLSVLDDDFAMRYVVHDDHSSRRRASTSSSLQGHQGASPHGVRRRVSSSSSLAGVSSSLTAFRLPRAASGHMSARNDTLVVVSELVSILESCDDVRDLRGLREILRRQLPDDVSLPAPSPSPSPPADVDVPIIVEPWPDADQKGERVTATQAVMAGRTGLHYECQEFPMATEELILSWFPKGVKVVQARDPGTTGNFEITVNGRLVHSKKTQSQGFFEAAPQARQDAVKAEIAKEVEVLGDAAPTSTGDFKDGKETPKGGCAIQ
ncbi:unnamed protein product [Symbiodinium sp. CCMP2592]|nr:unnamed protein product [Symbiodinium sp. CCMP2592]